MPSSPSLGDYETNAPCQRRIYPHVRIHRTTRYKGTGSALSGEDGFPPKDTFNHRVRRVTEGEVVVELRNERGEWR